VLPPLKDNVGWLDTAIEETKDRFALPYTSNGDHSSNPIRISLQYTDAHQIEATTAFFVYGCRSVHDLRLKMRFGVDAVVEKSVIIELQWRSRKLPSNEGAHRHQYVFYPASATRWRVYLTEAYPLIEVKMLAIVDRPNGLMSIASDMLISVFENFLLLGTNMGLATESQLERCLWECKVNYIIPRYYRIPYESAGALTEAGFRERYRSRAMTFPGIDTVVLKCTATVANVRQLLKTLRMQQNISLDMMKLIPTTTLRFLKRVEGCHIDKADIDCV